MRKVYPYTFGVQRSVCYASSSSRRENAPAAGRALRCDIGLDLGLVLAVTAPKSISHRSLLDQTNQALQLGHSRDRSSSSLVAGSMPTSRRFKQHISAPLPAPRKPAPHDNARLHADARTHILVRKSRAGSTYRQSGTPRRLSTDPVSAALPRHLKPNWLNWRNTDYLLS